MSALPLPWTFDHDPCQQATYGNDWPLTAAVPGISIDGDGDYKPCFARVKFGASVPHAEQNAAMLRIVTAVNAHDDLLAALLALRAAVESRNFFAVGGAFEDRGYATVAIARAEGKA